MNKPEQLLNRLNEIGNILSQKPDAVALIGLGSVGMETQRLDQFSDLDFYVIVKAGSKPRYLQDLDWLSAIAPVAYYFANTPDGYKLLYEDGVFCEFAVFEEEELKEAVFSPGRVLWKANDISDDIGIPQRAHKSGPPPATEWLIGEAITNLYVGVLRDRRGEKLSAMRFIQNYAVDRVLELSEKVLAGEAIARDDFNIERRYEKRFPAMTRYLPEFLQGYKQNQASALAILSYLDENFDVNSSMKQAILDLCERNE